MNIQAYREGGHALLKLLIDVGGGDAMVANRVKMQAEELYYCVKSAAGEDYEMNRKTELPRHKALNPASCPEDSMGGDLVEYPVVFLARLPTWYGSRSKVPAS